LQCLAIPENSHPNIKEVDSDFYHSCSTQTRQFSSHSAQTLTEYRLEKHKSSIEPILSQGNTPQVFESPIYHSPEINIPKAADCAARTPRKTLVAPSSYLQVVSNSNNHNNRRLTEIFFFISKFDNYNRN